MTYSALKVPLNPNQPVDMIVVYCTAYHLSSIFQWVSVDAEDSNDLQKDKQTNWCLEWQSANWLCLY